MKNLLHNDRGIALLIVLLVTVLLIALVFEFAYGTRVSLRAAMNYRDSQRAHYLARSGVGYAWWNLVNMPDNLVHGEWQVVPIVSTGDTEVRVRWEDEIGKLNITLVKDKYFDRLEKLFDKLSISQEILAVISEKDNNTFRLLTELHLIMNDDDFNKVAGFLTVCSKEGGDKKININTASEEVLYSADVNESLNIIENRPHEGVPSSLPTTEFTTESTYAKIYSIATVGDYSRQIEAIIHWDKGNKSTFDILYWRVL